MSIGTPEIHPLFEVGNGAPGSSRNIARRNLLELSMSLLKNLLTWRPRVIVVGQPVSSRIISSSSGVSRAWCAALASVGVVGDALSEQLSAGDSWCGRNPPTGIVAESFGLGSVFVVGEVEDAISEELSALLSRCASARATSMVTKFCGFRGWAVVWWVSLASVVGKCRWRELLSSVTADVGGRSAGEVLIPAEITWGG